jgi:predicted nucleic acid-binding protein
MQDATALQPFLRLVEVLDFRVDAAPHYAHIRADLKKRANDRSTASWPQARGNRHGFTARTR